MARKSLREKEKSNYTGKKTEPGGEGAAIAGLGLKGKGRDPASQDEAQGTPT